MLTKLFSFSRRYIKVILIILVLLLVSTFLMWWLWFTNNKPMYDASYVKHLYAYGELINDPLANAQFTNHRNYIVIDNSGNPYEDGNIRLAVIDASNTKTILPSTSLPGTFNDRMCTLKAMDVVTSHSVYITVQDANFYPKAPQKACQRHGEIYKVDLQTDRVTQVNSTNELQTSHRPKAVFTECFEFNDEKVCAQTSAVDFSKTNPWDGSIQGAVTFTSSEDQSQKLCCGYGPKLGLIGFNKKGDFLFTEPGLVILPRTYFLNATENGTL